MSDHGTLSPAGWYPDPAGGPAARYWDGAAWTTHVTAPQQAPVLLPPPPLRAPAGTSWNTPWIWLAILTPLVLPVVMVLIPWSSLISDLVADVEAMQYAGPRRGEVVIPGMSLFVWEVVLVALSWLVAGAVIVFAALDVRALRARGVPEPFHWAWSLLGAVYSIGRSVVVTRRTGHGWIPLVVEICVIVVTTVASIGISLWIVGQVLTPLAPYLSDLQYRGIR